MISLSVIWSSRWWPWWLYISRWDWWTHSCACVLITVITLTITCNMSSIWCTWKIHAAASASSATAAVSAAGDGAALLPTNLANWILRGWINEYLSKCNSSSSCHSWACLFRKIMHTFFLLYTIISYYTRLFRTSRLLRFNLFTTVHVYFVWF